MKLERVRASDIATAIVNTLEGLGLSLNEGEFDAYNDGWSPEDKRNALAYLKALESFEFVYVLISLQRSLLYLKEATVKLQGQSQDIAYGIATIQRCCAELKTLRADIDNYSHRIFEHSCRVAERSGITVTMP